MPQQKLAPCPAGLIELRNSLKREISDEVDASSRYREASIKLRHYKLDEVADWISRISFDEFMHKAVLEATIELITLECGE